ncbi:hypothetical protein [Hymenobacter ruricola]|uniref:Uncharacterized protein n=1 Tax=Hymenobacter ruricola TaxID=2791023 RepID=A0ABS0I391_9BACT|nr:hypothetical protein [Hymenobacter ruricola]MBF9221256.1 hypothetical protein [Hymenobacter ruricola]
MTPTFSFSALPLAAQWRAVIQLRRDIVRRLGRSSAPLAWWHRAVLEANPVLEWPAAHGPAVVRRGKALLDRVARCYLVTPLATPATADPIDEELLALLP